MSSSEGSTILMSLGEPHFIDQRCQIEIDALGGALQDAILSTLGLRHARDFGSQVPLFSRATLKRSGRLGTRLHSR